MKVKDMSIYHKNLILEFDKIGERVPEMIFIKCNGIEHVYRKVKK